jgi:hypothetical protein
MRALLVREISDTARRCASERNILSRRGSLQ